MGARRGLDTHEKAAVDSGQVLTLHNTEGAPWKST